jgi:acyl carrier protein
MANDDLREEIKAIIAEIGEIDDSAKITDEADLFSDLGLDSMQAMEIVLEIERRLHVTVAEADLQSIRSLGAALKVAKQGQGPRGPK